jgi:hypothetical protein
MESSKNCCTLEIFYRALRGEWISVKKIAEEYQVSTKTIGRYINEIQQFLSENRELMQNAELLYSHKEKAYYLHADDFLENKELFALVKLFLSDNQSVLKPAPMNSDFLLQSYPFEHANQQPASTEQGLLFDNLYAVSLLEPHQKMVRLSMLQGIHWNIPVAGSSLSTLDKSDVAHVPSKDMQYRRKNKRAELHSRKLELLLGFLIKVSLS